MSCTVYFLMLRTSSYVAKVLCKGGSTESNLGEESLHCKKQFDYLTTGAAVTRVKWED